MLDSLKEYNWLDGDQIIKVRLEDSVEEYGIEGVEIPDEITGYKII
jgi:hypothetical protein